MYVYSIEVCLRLMSLMGVNPLEDKQNLHNVLFLMAFIPLLSMCYLPFSNFQSKSELAALDVILAFGCSASYADCAVKMLNFKIQRDKLRTILLIIKKHFWDIEYDIDDIERTKQEQESKRITNSMKTYGITLTCIWFVYWFMGFISKKEFSEDAMPVPSYKRLGIPWYIMWLYMLYTDLVLISVMFISDTLLKTFFLLARLQFSLLNYRMRRIFYKKDSEIEEEIRSCAQYLNVLMMHLVFAIFSKVLLYYMLMAGTTICMQMFVASFSNSKDARWSALEFASLYVFQFIFIYCHPAQLMLNEAGDIATNLYLSNWKKEPKFYRDIILLLGKSQQRFSVSAGGFIELNYESGLRAFKTMFSYYTFLRTVSSPAE